MPDEPTTTAASVSPNRLAALPGDDTLGDGPRGNRPAEPEAAPATAARGSLLRDLALVLLGIGFGILVGMVLVGEGWVSLNG